MVMYAPGGVAALLMMNVRLAAFGHLRRIWTCYLGLAGTALVALVGVAAMVEMIYHLQLNAAMGPELGFMGATLNAHGLSSWFGALFASVTGVGLFELCRREFVRQWGEANEAIEQEIKRRETA